MATLNKAANPNNLYQNSITANRNGTNTANSDYWQANADKTITHFVDGVAKGTVAQNDSLGRYNNALTALRDQNGGVNPIFGSVNDPTGFSQVKNMYADSGKKQNKAAKGQIDAALGFLNTDRDRANKNFDAAQKALYSQYMQGQKNMGQQLAASGLGKTGMSESTMAAANTDYQNTYASNEQARNNALQDIANQIAQVQADGAKTMADLEAGNADKLAAAYQNLLSADQQNARADRDYDLQRRQMDTDNQMNVMNMLMQLNATSPTLYKQIQQQLFPGMTTADMITYNLQQSANKYNAQAQQAQAQRLAQQATQKK